LIHGEGFNAKARKRNTWHPAGDFSQVGRIVVKDLTLGTVYTFQVRAMGGNTGYSDWINPVSHMAI
jgi:hypothetical protein